MQNPVIQAAIKSEPVEQPSDLVTLAELAAEGHGTVDALLRELAALVIVPRDAAQRLLEERAAAEERRRVQQRRRAEEWAKRHPRPRRGIPAMGELSALETMAAHAGEDEARREAAGERLASLMRGETTAVRFTQDQS